MALGARLITQQPVTGPEEGEEGEGMEVAAEPEGETMDGGVRVGMPEEESEVEGIHSQQSQRF